MLGTEAEPPRNFRSTDPANCIETPDTTQTPPFFLQALTENPEQGTNPAEAQAYAIIRDLFIPAANNETGVTGETIWTHLGLVKSAPSGGNSVNYESFYNIMDAVRLSAADHGLFADQSRERARDGGDWRILNLNHALELIPVEDSEPDSPDPILDKYLTERQRRGYETHRAHVKKTIATSVKIPKNKPRFDFEAEVNKQFQAIQIEIGRRGIAGFAALPTIVLPTLSPLSILNDSSPVSLYKGTLTTQDDVTWRVFAKYFMFESIRNLILDMSKRKDNLSGQDRITVHNLKALRQKGFSTVGEIVRYMNAFIGLQKESPHPPKTSTRPPVTTTVEP